MSDGAALLTRTFAERHLGRAGHVNIQHYAQLISDATQVAVAGAGLPVGTALFTPTERVRFRAEMHAGDEASVHAAVQQVSADSLTLTGTLVRARDDRLVCQFTRRVEPVDARTWAPMPWRVLPSPGGGVDDVEIAGISEAFEGEPVNELLADVGPDDVDTNNLLTARMLWHQMTEALWGAQAKLGADQHTLARKQITGGATVFELEHVRGAPLGTRLSVVTRIVGYGESSLRMRHDIRDADAPDVTFVRARYVLTYFSRSDGRRRPLADVLSEPPGPASP